VPVPEDDFPEYYEQIKKPMDYGTMKEKVENAEYRSAQAMQKDFILVVQNCLKFNAHDSDIVQEAKEQALMRPKLLREAAAKHDLFLAEDGTVFQIIDDDKKNKGTPKKPRKRRQKEDDAKKFDQELKPKRKRKNMKVLYNSDAADSGGDDSDVPLSSMKSKKSTRIKISVPEDSLENSRSKGKKRRRQDDDDDDDFVDDVVDNGGNDEDIKDLQKPKKRGRKPKGDPGSAKKRGRKKKEADTDQMDQDSGRSEAANEGSNAQLSSASLKDERKRLGDAFEDARNFFTKRGTWSLPSHTDPSKFKDVALRMLSKLSILDRYSIFAKPVDEEEAPGYYEVVKNPVDMLAIKAKVEDGTYGTGSEAAKSLYEDILLMFDNCALYNDDDGEVIEEATRIFGMLPETYALVCETVLKKYPK